MKISRCGASLFTLVLAVAACAPTPSTPKQQGVIEGRVGNTLARPTVKPAGELGKVSPSPSHAATTGEGGTTGLVSPSPVASTDASASPAASPSSIATKAATGAASPSPGASASAGTGASASPSASPGGASSPSPSPSSAASASPSGGSSPGTFGYIRNLLVQYTLETDSTAQMGVLGIGSDKALVVPDGTDIQLVAPTLASPPPPMNLGTLVGGAAVAGVQAVAVSGSTIYAIGTLNTAFTLFTVTISPLTLNPTVTTKALQAPSSGPALKRVGGLVLKDASTLIAADTRNHALYKVAIADGSVTTYAGTPGTSGVAIAGTQVALNDPTALAIAGTTLYVTDAGNHRILTDDLTKDTFSVLLGTGVSGTTDGGFDSAQVNGPDSIFLDGNSLYIADTGNNVVRVGALDTQKLSTISIQSGGIQLPNGRGIGEIGGTIYGADNAGELFSFTPSL